MSRFLRPLALGLLVLPLLGLDVPRAESDMEELLRASNAAFRHGDLDGAARLLEEAQRLAPEPRLVAFNLATVYYHQARAGRPAALAEAEVYYRCCLEPEDPRRAEALLGLGNCLLLRGSAGRLDALSLRAAIDRFTLCRREPGCSATTAAAARYNAQRARLLLLQTPPPADAPTDSSSGEPDSEKPEDPRPSQPAGERKPDGSGAAEPDPRGKIGPEAKAEETQAKGRPAPGRGAEVAVPDQADAPPLGAADAAAHLEAALERISVDWRRHRRSRARPARPSVRDW